MATEGVSAGTQAVLGAFGMPPSGWQFGLQQLTTAAASPHPCRLRWISCTNASVSAA
jgi:hypothetical protein